jgi:hypothetical protein
MIVVVGCIPLPALTGVFFILGIEEAGMILAPSLPNCFLN